MRNVAPTPWQSQVLQIPEAWNIALPGGRGGGKSYGVGLETLRHLTKYSAAAKVLVLRENYKGLQQIEETIVLILEQAFPGRVKFNRQDHMVRIVDGGTVEFGQIDGPGAVSKFMGRECTLLLIDEAGLLREWRWVTLLKSNLRSPHDIPLRTIFTANPGGAQHGFIFKTYIAGRRAWHPFEVDGETWVTCPSTLLDNPYLNAEDYTKSLSGEIMQDCIVFSA
jgi:hypothetical protein